MTALTMSGLHEHQTSFRVRLWFSLLFLLTPANWEHRAHFSHLVPLYDVRTINPVCFFLFILFFVWFTDLFYLFLFLV